jgi:hypothetical protein
MSTEENLGNHLLHAVDSKYGLGNPQGGNIWGRHIKWSDTDDWRHEAYDTGNSQGSKFIYLGTSRTKYKFLYSFDCTIPYPFGDKTNWLTVAAIKNGMKISEKTYTITLKGQVVGEFSSEIQNGDVLYLALTQRELTNALQLGDYPAMNDFSGMLA